ncbi:MAG: DUF2293 domain-containing protein [Stappiaceae bacterium]
MDRLKKRDPKSYRPDMALKTFKKADYRKALRRIVPLAPMLAANTILDRAQSSHMSRLPPGIAVWQATVSHIRHAETDYEALLSDGYDRGAARYFVLDDMNAVLEQWGSSQFLSTEDDVS